MGQVISLIKTLHETNVTRIAKYTLESFGTTATSTDIAERVAHPQPGLNNWFIIKFIIDRHYPSPSLCHVRDPGYVEMEVIRQLLLSMHYPLVERRKRPRNMK